jgi:hypothetical protein
MAADLPPIAPRGAQFAGTDDFNGDVTIDIA